MLCSRLQQIGLAAALICAPALAMAQRWSAYQDGTLVPGDALKAVTQGRYGKAGGLQGDANGLGQNPHSITDRGAIGLCSNSAATGGEYNALCLGHDPDGTGILSLDSYGGMAPKSFKLRLNGQDYELPGSAAVVGSDAAVAHTTALKASLGVAGQRLVRLGYAAAGDGGRAEYNWSSSTCSAADDGAQVQPSGAGCWVADFTGMRPTPKIWGAVGNGTTNDTAKVQAALTAMSGRTLFIDDSSYCVTGLTVPSNTTVQGTNGRSSKITPCASNVTMFTLGTAGALHDLYIDAGANGNTGNTAISTVNVNNVNLENLTVSKACIGWDEAGILNRGVRLNISETQNVSGCFGVRFGHTSTGGATTEATLASSVVNGGGGASLMIEDCGGCFIGPNVDLIGQTGAQRGLWIIPGLNQAVKWLTVHNSYVSDTTSGIAGIDIDTGNSTAEVGGLVFNATWNSASQQEGVRIRNTANGEVNGIHFTAHRSFFNIHHGFHVYAGVANVTLDNSYICGNSQSGVDQAHSIVLESGVNDVAIRNTLIGGKCGGLPLESTPLTGILLAGNNKHITITGNDLQYNTSAIFGMPTENSIVLNNRGIDNAAYPSVFAASDLLITTVFPRQAINGTTTINRISGFWNGRQIKFVTVSGAVTFTPAGGAGMVCNSFTSAGANATVLADYDGFSGCWFLH